MQRRKKLWVTVLGGLVAVAMLYFSTGSWLLTGLCLAAVAAYLMYPVKRPSAVPRCLNCGETLKVNARACDSCGSSRWTVN